MVSDSLGYLVGFAVTELIFPLWIDMRQSWNICGMPNSVSKKIQRVRGLPLNDPKEEKLISIMFLVRIIEVFSSKLKNLLERIWMLEG